MSRVLFGIARVLIGAIGLWWLVIGFLGIAMSSVEREWGMTFMSAAYMLVGFCLLYGAAIRFPWEAKRRETPPGGEDGPEAALERARGSEGESPSNEPL